MDYEPTTPKTTKSICPNCYKIIHLHIQEINEQTGLPESWISSLGYEDSPHEPDLFANYFNIIKEMDEEIEENRQKTNGNASPVPFEEEFEEMTDYRQFGLQKGDAKQYFDSGCHPVYNAGTGQLCMGRKGLSGFVDYEYDDSIKISNPRGAAKPHPKSYVADYFDRGRNNRKNNKWARTRPLPGFLFPESNGVEPDYEQPEIKKKKKVPVPTFLQTFEESARAGKLEGVKQKRKKIPVAEDYMI
jgi:hypothetical protein